MAESRVHDRFRKLQTRFELTPCALPQWLGSFKQHVTLAYELKRDSKNGSLAWLFRCDSPFAQSWYGCRWVFLSAPLSGLPLAGIASSRLDRCWESHSTWMTRIRQLTWLSRSRFCWLNVTDTTAAKWANRAAQAAAAERVRCEVTPDFQAPDRAWNHWLDRIEELFECGTIQAVDYEQPSLVFSPQFAPVFPKRRTDIPARDAVLFSTTDWLFALHVRNKSTTQRLIRRRQKETLRRTLTFALKPTILDHSWDEPDPVVAQPQIIDRLPWPALYHWTRRCPGVWPGESEAAFLDATLLQSVSANHGPLATLRRILKEGRIRGSSRCIAAQSPVVCWTEQPLDDWPKLRTFRSHRHRWDFEPYGIAIDRDWLASFGARRVHYVDDQDDGSISSDARVFTQRRSSRNSGIDWETEREWRSCGDLWFKAVPVDRLAVFVPTLTEASSLSHEFPYAFKLTAQSKNDPNPHEFDLPKAPGRPID